MVKFGYTINYVSDVEEALVFFEKSFSMMRLFITEEKDYGELDTGQTTLAFASHELGRSNFEGGYVSPTELGKPLGVEIALVSDNVQSIHDSAIRNGAKELKAPETKPWGQTVSYVQSPGGILLELCSPIAK